MKKLLLLTISLLLSIQTYAQDPDIFEEWHLYNLIIDGVDHVPNYLQQPLNCTFYEESGENFFFSK